MPLEAPPVYGSVITSLMNVKNGILLQRNFYRFCALQVCGTIIMPWDGFWRQDFYILRTILICFLKKTYILFLTKMVWLLAVAVGMTDLQMCQMYVGGSRSW